jgi:ankyrin repeat protein
MDGRGETPLHEACHAGRTDLVTLLMAAGANLGWDDGLDRTLLHIACNLDHTKVATLQVAAGASAHCTDLNFKLFTVIP